MNLQSLVNHTARRIVETQKDIFILNRGLLSNELTLMYKWGCDGSSGHSTYKQGFNTEGDQPHTDFSLFSVCIVPLQMITTHGTIVWQNDRTSSTRFCRPLKLIFKKETLELSKQEISNVENQIQKIVATNIEQFQIAVKHDFKLTMMDGKMFSVVSNSSNQSCGICGATPKIMNDLDKVLRLPANESLYEYGISCLHAWIRCLECCLHISYRLSLKKWQIRGEDDKKALKERKDYVIGKLKKDLSLLVDIPKQGYGTTNDGNTARKFFRNYNVTSEITGRNSFLVLL